MIPEKPEGQDIVHSFACAWAGIAAAARGRNFRIQLGFAVAALALGILFHISMTQWLAVIICMGLVLGSECLNTAMEAVVDLASPELHPLAKTAKDAAAGAVLCFSIASFVVGVVVFAPPILQALVSIG